MRFDILSDVSCCCNLAICFYCQAASAVVLRGVCAGSQDSPEPVWWKSSSTRELHQEEREKDCLQLRWINSLIVLIGAVALVWRQHEEKDGAGEEKELTKEGTIAAFNGVATLKC